MTSQVHVTWHCLEQETVCQSLSFVLNEEKNKNKQWKGKTLPGYMFTRAGRVEWESENNMSAERNALFAERDINMYIYGRRINRSDEHPAAAAAASMLAS